MHALIVIIAAGILGITRKYLVTGTQFRKSWNDLWERPGRALLVVVALTIGLWGLGSLAISTHILRQDLNENYLRTKPAQAVLLSKDFDSLDLAAFRKWPEIESAEFRDFSLQRIEVYPDEWIPLWLFGVEDFTNVTMAQIYRVTGDSIPATGSMLIERDCMTISSLDAGKWAKVRAGSRELEIPVSGVCFDPAQAPATQDHFVYGYVDKQTYQQITGEPANERLIIRVKDAGSKEDVEGAVSRIVERFKASGITVTSAKIGRFNEHPHQWQLNTLLFLQGAVSMLAFLMSAVLVSQLMASILSQQIRQIGMLKAIGAARRQVLQIYVLMVLILGAFAGAVSIPLSVWSGFGFARFVATKINFEILTSRLPIHMYLVLLALSILLPVTLSLPSILRGVRIPVREALSDYGIVQSGRGLKKKRSSVMRPLPSSLVLALRNVGRRKRRLVVTVAAMGLGVAVFASGFNVRQSLVNLLLELKDGLRFDAEVVFRDQMPKSEALAPFQSLSNVSRVETWSGGYGELQSTVVSTERKVGIVALPYNTSLFRLPVVEGRWLHHSDETEVVMNRQALEIYTGLSVGDYVSLNLGGRELRVKLVGVVDQLEKAKLYMDIEKYDSFANPDHLVNSLYFVARDRSYSQVRALKRNIEQVIASSNLEIMYARVPADRVKIIYDHLNIILTTIVFLAFLVLLVAALGMASATGINILERTREIGVLRAIGATPRKIYGMFVAEGMVVSGAGIAVGLLMAWPLSSLASPFFGSLMLGDGGILKSAFSPLGFIVTLVTTLVFGWFASRIPARSAVKVSTRDALTYE